MLTLHKSAKEKAFSKRMEEVERIATEFGATEIAEKARGLIAVLPLGDTALNSSSAQALVASISNFLAEVIEKLVGSTQLFRRSIDDLFAELSGKAFGDANHIPQLDKLGKMLLGILDKTLREWSDVVQATQLTFMGGCEVKNVHKLQKEIELAKSLRKLIAENWPWAYPQNQKPVDKDMVAESRTAFLVGECESIEQVIERFGGHAPTQE